ncbi:uncharacterized protein LOC129602107 [Paramacrobiotus metropolitanus]|uniref:uncharacterized protein LOC129602107 n=1 Tax=Paramacrobiotus metropolitanus TaxID=2943436 RepID=UPI002445DFDC|nr:uncharacterized protein LOC129602107 [Paramacrobiotus metropolitanus]
MDKAVRAVESRELSQYAAARVYRVPRTSLWERLKGVRRMKPGDQARNFSAAEEDYIEQLLLKCPEQGVPLNKAILRRIIPTLASTKDMPERRKKFTDFWHREFLKRHPKISQRISHGVSRKKARQWTPTTREGWIRLLSDLHCSGGLTDPRGIWNFDESAFQVAEKVITVYALRGTKNVLSYFDGNDRELITVLAGGNAAGEILRTLILFDGKVFLTSHFHETSNRCHIGFNSSGVMDNATFTSYIREEVIPRMTAEKLTTIFLICSTWNFLSECVKSDKEISVVILPSGQTGKLQPMDLRVFGPLKKYWRDYLRKLTLTPTEEVTKQNFAAHFVKNWDNFNMSANIVSGFVASGIYPFNPEAVCQAYMEPVAAPVSEDVPLSVANVYVSELEKVRVALREIHLLNEAAVENCIEFVVRQAEGFVPAVVPEKLADDWHLSVMGAHNPKKRKLKESRLHAEAGLIATDSKVIAALEQREKEKAEKMKKSKKTTARALTDVTNTPQKKRFKMAKK